MTDFEKDLKEILAENDEIEIDEENLKILKQKVRENAQKSNPPRKFKFALVTACLAIMLIAGIILGYTLRGPGARYSDLSGCYTAKIQGNQIADYVPDNLNFPYEALQGGHAFYDGEIYLTDDNDSYVAISLTYYESSMPFTKTYIRICTDDRFDFSDSDKYKDGATVREADQFMIYEKSFINNGTLFLYRYIEHEDYRIYISIDKNNEIYINSLVDEIITN